MGREISSENSRGQYLKLAGYGTLGFLSILKLDCISNIHSKQLDLRYLQVRHERAFYIKCA